jgi:hypothetical protein
MKLNRLVKRLPEAMTLEPVIAFYNAGNFSNFTTDTSVLQNTTAAGGAINNVYGRLR